MIPVIVAGAAALVGKKIFDEVTKPQIYGGPDQ